MAAKDMGAHDDKSAMRAASAETGNGWESSAEAWIADMGDSGDFSRRNILDAPMRARLPGRGYREALDIGCGEGRFCRILAEAGISATGLDPVARLIEAAKARDPAGRYLTGRAEALPFRDASFDLVVSYVSLVDIDAAETAIREAARVLRPGGRFLIANLNAFSTAGGFQRRADGSSVFEMDRYLEARAEWVGWRGIKVRNWHRPMSHYMGWLLGAGLELRHFEEPPVRGGLTGGEAEIAARYARAPWFHVMEWQKPG